MGIHKKRGSLLIEALVTIMILAVVFNVMILSIAHINKSKIRRDVNEKISRVIYAIMNEIKYNYSLDEMKERLKGDGISFEYSDEFMEQLIDKPLLEMKEGNDITINEGILNKDNMIELVLMVNIDIGDELIKVERKFIKSLWMESINE